MQTKNKNCTSLNYFNWYKQTQKPHPNRKTFNHINGNLYHYAGNNPVRYIDPDGNEIVNFSITTMQNYKGNIPHTNTSFSKAGCTFATMAGIVDDYRAKNGLAAIDWNNKLEKGELDNYFTNNGDLKRADFLNDFSDGNLKILEDTKENLSTKLDNAINDKDNDYYIAARAPINAGTQGKTEHEVGIIGRRPNSDSKLISVGSSKYDKDRTYTTESDVVGGIKRLIKIGVED